MFTITSRTGFEKPTARFFKRGLRKRIYRLMILGIAPFLAIPIPAVAQTMASFDVPGSRQTDPQSINSSGAITGYYETANVSRYFSFVRDPQGAIVTFAFPYSLGTWAQSINSAGAITGNYKGLSSYYGFVRDPHGFMTTFNPAGSLFTFAASINAAGSITDITKIRALYFTASSETFRGRSARSTRLGA